MHFEKTIDVMFQEAKFTFTLVVCQRIQIQFVIFPVRDVKVYQSVYLGQQQNFLFVYPIQIICDQKHFSRLSKGGHFSTTSGLFATCSRHALHKVCLLLGRERHCSRGRPSPCTSNHVAVLLHPSCCVRSLIMAKLQAVTHQRIANHFFFLQDSQPRGMALHQMPHVLVHCFVPFPAMLTSGEFFSELSVVNYFKVGFQRITPYIGKKARQLIFEASYGSYFCIRPYSQSMCWRPVLLYFCFKYALIGLFRSACYGLS